MPRRAGCRPEGFDTFAEVCHRRLHWKRRRVALAPAEAVMRRLVSLRPGGPCLAPGRARRQPRPAARETRRFDRQFRAPASARAMMLRTPPAPSASLNGGPSPTCQCPGDCRGGGQGLDRPGGSQSHRGDLSAQGVRRALAERWEDAIEVVHDAFCFSPVTVVVIGAFSRKPARGSGGRGGPRRSGHARWRTMRSPVAQARREVPPSRRVAPFPA